MLQMAIKEKSSGCVADVMSERIVSGNLMFNKPVFGATPTLLHHIGNSWVNLAYGLKCFSSPTFLKCSLAFNFFLYVFFLAIFFKLGRFFKGLICHCKIRELIICLLLILQSELC